MVTEIIHTASTTMLVLFAAYKGQNYTDNQYCTLLLGTEDLVMCEESI